METTKIALKSTQPVEAASIGLTPKAGYRFVIKEAICAVKSGTSKNGEPFSFAEYEYRCAVIKSLQPETISDDSCRGLMCSMRVSTRKGEPEERLLNYNRGVLESAGINVTNFGDTEIINAEVVGKEFDGFVKEDKAGYTYIDLMTLRQMNSI